jgi:glycosyltransferase involved in cell wall biosynthesis
MEELISVIVSVYNSELTLGHTLRCISEQTYRNLEIILVDDGSTDSSGKICDAFAEQDPRCKVIHKPNEGQGSAKNAGQAIATGDYLFFPDSDDTFNLDMLRILHEAVSSNPEYDIAISDREIVNDWDTDTTPPDCSNGAVNTVELSKDDLIQGLFFKHNQCYVYGWNKLYRKKLLDNIWCGDYPRHQDFDFNFRVYLNTRKAIFVELPLYHWVHWSGSKTHHADNWGIYYKCRTAILYNNWTSLRDGDRIYGHYLLDALYRAMVLWEEWSRNSDITREVRAICNSYRKKTVCPYLKNVDIKFYMKVICLTLLSFPGLSHVVMKMTSNSR